MDDLISRLSELRCQYNCFDENERDAYHTLSEAIKALSDVPDTNVGDTISRQAAIDVVRSYYDECDKREESIEERIEQLPSADVQPVQHGKWIKAQRKGIISYADGYAECNKCHEVSYLGWNDKYCRNCGARMDGEQDVHSK